MVYGVDLVDKVDATDPVSFAPLPRIGIRKHGQKVAGNIPVVYNGYQLVNV